MEIHLVSARGNCTTKVDAKDKEVIIPPCSHRCPFNKKQNKILSKIVLFYIYSGDLTFFDIDSPLAKEVLAEGSNFGDEWIIHIHWCPKSVVEYLLMKVYCLSEIDDTCGH